MMSPLGFWVVVFPVLLALLLNTAFVIAAIRDDLKNRASQGGDYEPTYNWHDLIVGYAFSAIPLVSAVAIIAMLANLYTHLNLKNKPLVPKK